MLYPLWDAGVSVGHQVVSVADAVAGAVHDLPDGHRAARLARRSRASRHRWRTLREARAFAGVVQRAPSCRQLHRAARGAVASAPPALRRLGLPARARREERRAAACAISTSRCGRRARASRTEQPRTSCAARRAAAARGRASSSARWTFLWCVRNSPAPRARGGAAIASPSTSRRAIARALGYATRARRGRDAERSWPRDGRELHVRLLPARARDRARPRADPRPRQAAQRAADATRRRYSRPGVVSCERGIALRRVRAARERSGARAAPVRGRGRRATCRCSRVRATRSRAPRPSRAFARRCARAREAAQLVREAGRDARSAPPFRRDSILAELHDVGLLLGDDPRVRAGRRPRAPRHLPRVHGRRALGGRGRSPARAGARRARARASARLPARRPRSRARKCCSSRRCCTTWARPSAARITRGAARRWRARILHAPRPRAEDVDDVCHLILKHLAMYLVATRRDLDDPATIAEFVRTSARARGAARPLPAHGRRSCRPPAPRR